MRTINWSRIVLGGSLAGLVLIILTAAATAVFIGQHDLRTATQGNAARLFFVFAFLFLGTLMTLSYAAIRPRFGAGSKTAALAAGAVWLIAVGGAIALALKNAIAGEPYALFSGPLLPVLYLLIMIASTMAGASVYREQQR